MTIIKTRIGLKSSVLSRKITMGRPAVSCHFWRLERLYKVAIVRKVEQKLWKYFVGRDNRYVMAEMI